MTFCCACRKLANVTVTVYSPRGTALKSNSPSVIRFLVLHPIRMLRLQIHGRVLNGPVLRIMDDAMHGAKNFRASRRGAEWSRDRNTKQQ